MGACSARFHPWYITFLQFLNLLLTIFFIGDFKGYKIRVQPEGENKPREMRVPPNATNAIVDILKPASLNTVTILPYNGQYDGPISTEVLFHFYLFFWKKCHFLRKNG